MNSLSFCSTKGPLSSKKRRTGRPLSWTISHPPKPFALVQTLVPIRHDVRVHVVACRGLHCSFSCLWRLVSDHDDAQRVWFAALPEERFSHFIQWSGFVTIAVMYELPEEVWIDMLKDLDTANVFFAVVAEVRIECVFTSIYSIITNKIINHVRRCCCSWKKCINTIK